MILLCHPDLRINSTLMIEKNTDGQRFRVHLNVRVDFGEYYLMWQLVRFVKSSRGSRVNAMNNELGNWNGIQTRCRVKAGHTSCVVTT